MIDNFVCNTESEFEAARWLQDEIVFICCENCVSTEGAQLEYKSQANKQDGDDVICEDDCEQNAEYGNQEVDWSRFFNQYNDVLEIVS